MHMKQVCIPCSSTLCRRIKSLEGTLIWQRSHWYHFDETISEWATCAWASACSCDSNFSEQIGHRSLDLMVFNLFERKSWCRWFFSKSLSGKKAWQSGQISHPHSIAAARWIALACFVILFTFRKVSWQKVHCTTSFLTRSRRCLWMWCNFRVLESGKCDLQMLQASQSLRTCSKWCLLQWVKKRSDLRNVLIQ